MHYLMLVTVEADSSKQARITVFEALARDATFCGQIGWFGVPVCDWFVIGGRWSGMLPETQMGKLFRDAVIYCFPEMADNWWPQSLADSHGKELDSLWQSHGGVGSSPYTRSDAGELGHEDDAMPLTAELYDELLSRFEGERLVADDGHCQYLDLQDELLTPDAIGSKWLVVVDYHN